MTLDEIKGLGEKRIKKLADAGIFSPLDLIMHFPVKYVDTSAPVDFSSIEDGAEIGFLGKVNSNPVTKFIRRGLSFVKVEFLVGDGKISVTWFNQNYIARQLELGKSFYVLGKVKRFNSTVSISSPTLMPYAENANKIVPLYKSIKGLPTSVLCEGISKTLKSVRVNSFLPSETSEKYHLMPLNYALRVLHLPTDMAEIDEARRTLAIENLSYTLSAFSLIKQNNSGNRVFYYKNNMAQLKLVMKSLPFILTDEQTKALEEIIGSLQNNSRMNRLLQGDVGCGKTIIAFLAMYYAKLSDFQSVLMAPTELLARQHYISAINIFEKFGVRVALLTGSQTALQRETTLFNIRNGQVDFIIGTHALIQDDVTFCNLSMVITDEQHRFGVNQRGLLENKAVGTDCLVMSATPIPRTLALTMYGDLEQSRIMTVPPRKASIKTKFVPSRKIEDMYAYIDAKAKLGEQTYVVCPRIEDEQDGLYSVAEVYKTLKARLGKCGISFLHGAMKESEKTSVMDKFIAGEIKVLVSTTVIEVGIDVPNATTMIIFNAERYGLSQLHQLRGRVGRGTTDSFCFVLSDNESSAVSRLEHFCSCNNGFELAEFDFTQRGAGDFIGTRQHGDGSFVPITLPILEIAREISATLVANEEIKARILNNVGENDYQYIKSLAFN